MTIDVHTHITPATIPERRMGGQLWPSIVPTGTGTASLVIDGKLFRTLDARAWDPALRLADMREDGLDAQVLSPMPELLSFWLGAADTRYLASHINTHIAAMVASAPDHFAGLGMVPAQDVAGAVAQLDEIARLGLQGIEIGTHINGVPLGDLSLWPLYEAAEARGLAIFVHPLHPCGIDRIGGVPEVGVVATFPLEIAMAAVSLMAAGIPRRFPGLRILLSHGGGALASILGRLERGRECSPPMRAALTDDARTAARKFWFDTNVYDPATLRFIAEQVGQDRLVIGSDYPFVLEQKRPRHFVDAALPGIGARCACNATMFLSGSASGVINAGTGCNARPAAYSGSPT